jgi:predicted DNA-binding transcriptional regulator YafY
MVYLKNLEVNKIIKELSHIDDDEIKKIIEKMKSPAKKLVYIYDRENIRKLLRKAFREKKKVKINYCSFSSDEVTNRVINIYQIHEDCIVAYCNLRGEERTFKIRSINKAALLDEKYEIPKGWTPESIILSKKD